MKFRNFKANWDGRNAKISFQMQGNDKTFTINFPIATGMEVIEGGITVRNDEGALVHLVFAESPTTADVNPPDRLTLLAVNVSVFKGETRFNLQMEYGGSKTNMPMGISGGPLEVTPQGIWINSPMPIFVAFEAVHRGTPFI
jgi:hypothetical protein